MAKLFEQTIDATPVDDNLRFAYGRAGVPTKNFTFTQFIAWLVGKLTPSFLLRSNNLSDVSNAATALANIGGASVTAVNAALANKEPLITYTEYQDCTDRNQVVNGATFYAKASRWGRMVSLVGEIQMDASTAGVVFKLPPSMPVAPVDIPFVAGDASGSTSENWEFYVKAGTIEVYVKDGSGNFLSSFNCTYIA